MRKKITAALLAGAFALSVLYRRRARMRGTDSTIEQEGATLWTVRDGKLVHGDFGDQADALEVAGLSE